jgi:hypothetical protein
VVAPRDTPRPPRPDRPRLVQQPHIARAREPPRRQRPRTARARQLAGRQRGLDLQLGDRNLQHRGSATRSSVPRNARTHALGWEGATGVDVYQTGGAVVALHHLQMPVLNSATGARHAETELRSTPVAGLITRRRLLSVGLGERLVLLASRERPQLEVVGEPDLAADLLGGAFDERPVIAFASTWQSRRRGRERAPGRGARRRSAQAGLAGERTPPLRAGLRAVAEALATGARPQR